MLCACALFVVTGVSSDNIFVVHETWLQSRSLLDDHGVEASRASRVRWTIGQSFRPLFVADVTTAFSLFVNCFSTLPAISQFGLAGGILILVNFGLVLCYMPALLVLHEMGNFRCIRCLQCSPRTSSRASNTAEHSQSRARLVHYVHRHLYRSRHAVLIAFTVVVGALLPSALSMFDQRSDGEFEIFGSPIDLPPEGLHWRGDRTSAAAPAEPASIEALPHTYRVFVNSSAMPYLAPRVEYALWPSGAGSLTAMMFIDTALLAVLLAVKVRKSLRRRRPVVTQGRCVMLVFALAFFAFACFLLAFLLVPMWALEALGCHFPVYLNSALAAGLLLHGVIFAYIAAAYLTKFFYFLSRRWLWADDEDSTNVSRLAKRKLRVAKGQMFCVLSLVCFALMAVVLRFMDERTAENSSARQWYSTGWHWWPIWPSLTLSLLILVWALLILAEAFATLFRPSYSDKEWWMRALNFSFLARLRPLGDNDVMRQNNALYFFALGATLFGCAFGVLVTGGIPAILPYNVALRGTGYMCVLTSALPFALAFSTLANMPVGIFQAPRLLPLSAKLLGLWYLVLSALLVAAGAHILRITFDATTREPNAAEDDASIALMWPHWPGLWLHVMLLAWSGVAFTSLRVTLSGKSWGHFLPGEHAAATEDGRVPAVSRASDESASAPAAADVQVTGRAHRLERASNRLKLLSACHITLQASAWIVLALSCFSSSTASAFRLILGYVLILTAGVCMLLTHVTAHARDLCGLIGPTSFQRRGQHLIGSAMFYVFLASLLLYAGLHCFEVVQLHMYALALGALWLTDALCCLHVCYVLITRRPAGCIRPLLSTSVAPDGIPSVRTVSRLEMFSTTMYLLVGACFLLAGVGACVLSGWYEALTFVFDHKSLPLTLSATLLLHTLPCLLLVYVFGTRNACHVFQPTESARRWRLVARGRALQSALLLVAFAMSGSLLLRTTLEGEDMFPSRLRFWLRIESVHQLAVSGRIVTIALAVILALDAMFFVCAATSQISGESWHIFRPLQTDHRLSTVASCCLTSCAASCAALSAGCAIVTCDASVCGLLWAAGAIPVFAEIVLSCHSAAFFASAVQIGRAVCARARPRSEVRVEHHPVIGVLMLPSGRMNLAMCFSIVTGLVSIVLTALLPFRDQPLHSRDQPSLGPEAQPLGPVPTSLRCGLSGCVHGRGHFELLGALSLTCCLYVLATLHGSSTQKPAKLAPLLLAAVLSAASSGAGYVLSLVPVGAKAASDGMLSGYDIIGPMMLLHVPALVCMALAEYSGTCVGGFAPRYEGGRDGNGGSFRSRRSLGCGLSALGCVCALVGTSMTYVAINAARGDRLAGSDEILMQVNIAEAELCALVWGVEPELRSEPGVPPHHEWMDGNGQVHYGGLVEAFRPETAEAQESFRLLCDALHAPGTVAHSASPRELCFGKCLFDFVSSNVSARFYTWPIPPEDFVPAVLMMMEGNRALTQYVGFRDAPGYPERGAEPARVAWIKIGLRSKYSMSAELYKRPDLVMQYRSEWATWFDELPAAVRALSEAQGRPTGTRLPQSPTESVLSMGFPTCQSHSLLPTVQAFLGGVTRALLLTPAFAILSLLVFLQDVFLCYAALYTLGAMIVTVLGLLRFLGLTLGAIESLAFALVIGVSVDYLVHFAYAFKHSLMPESYYKSRAVLLARSGSVFASGMTTLVAVVPLLASVIAPLRLFGLIFTVLAVVALVFAMTFFNAFLMIAGPGIPLSPTASMPASASARAPGYAGRSDSQRRAPASGGMGAAVLSSAAETEAALAQYAVPDDDSSDYASLGEQGLDVTSHGGRQLASQPAVPPQGALSDDENDPQPQRQAPSLRRSSSSARVRVVPGVQHLPPRSSTRSGIIAPRGGGV